VSRLFKYGRFKTFPLPFSGDASHRSQGGEKESRWGQRCSLERFMCTVSVMKRDVWYSLDRLYKKNAGYNVCVEERSTRMSIQIFVSYERLSGSAIADQMYAFFKGKYDASRQSFRPFLDKDTYGADDWWINICENIRGRSHFLALLSIGYMKSPYCLEEIHFANRTCANIIPVLIDSGLQPAEAEKFLKKMAKLAGKTPPQTIQIIDCSEAAQHGMIDNDGLNNIWIAVNRHPPQEFDRRYQLQLPRKPIVPEEAIENLKVSLSDDIILDSANILRELRALSFKEAFLDEVEEFIEKLGSKYDQFSLDEIREIEYIRKRLFSTHDVRSTMLGEAARRLGISSIYPSRNAVRDDIRDAINPNLTKNILLLGVSLNDFERAAGDFNDSWQAIRHLVEDAVKNSTQESQYEKGRANPEKISIKILIAHPYSMGAVLRSKSEDKNLSPDQRRLTGEVLRTAGQLNAMQQELRKRGVDSIELEAKLYITAPILFLCWTDNKSFVQQYYFWDKHEAATMPILAYEAGDTTGQRVHKQLQHHFEWIWKHASVPVGDFIAGHQHGVDTGLYQGGALNVYASNDEARERMLYLLKTAERRVWIQGITLYSFFGRNQELSKAFEIVVRKGLDTRVLLLDPMSDQAKYRSYREYLIQQEQQNAESVSYTEYLSQELYEEMFLKLHSEIVQKAIRHLKNVAHSPHFEYRLFDSAPACFLMVVDDHVIVEQYHYGNRVEENDSTSQPVLGKDMPKIEYGPKIPEIFLATEGESVEAINPVVMDEKFFEAESHSGSLSHVLIDHFEYAWETAHTPTR